MDVSVVLLPRLVDVKPRFCIGVALPGALCWAAWELPWPDGGIAWGIAGWGHKQKSVQK